MPDASAQKILDTRALEVASAALGRVEAIEAREEQREARAEAQRAELRSEMKDGFGKVEGLIMDLGKTVHARISAEKAARSRLVLTIGGSTILVLLTVCGYLFIKANGWG